MLHARIDNLIVSPWQFAKEKPIELSNQASRLLPSSVLSVSGADINQYLGEIYVLATAIAMGCNCHNSYSTMQ